MRFLLIVAPLALLAQWFGLPAPIVFVLAFVGMIPLAGFLGEATEVLAEYAGPKVGALLTATFGNAVELILLVSLLRSGQIDLVKSSIAGSILLSLLLVVGLAALLGGLKYGRQQVKSEHGVSGAPMMAMAVIGLALPTLLAMANEAKAGLSINTDFISPALEELSVGIAIILFLLYLLDLLFRFTRPEEAEVDMAALTEGIDAPKWSRNKALAVLIGSTVAVAIVSEVLSGSVEPFGELLGLSTLFMGVMILPLAGAIPEVIVAARFARKNQLDLALATVFDAAKQVALFVAPLLVFLGLFFGQELTLYFNFFEVIALALAVFVSILITRDAESNWMEGAQLLALYLILGLWFYFLVPAA